MPTSMKFRRKCIIFYGVEERCADSDEVMIAKVHILGLGLLNTCKRNVKTRCKMDDCLGEFMALVL